MSALEIDLAVQRAMRRAPRCMAVVYLRNLDSMPRQCSNRTNDSSGKCWRHR